MCQTGNENDLPSYHAAATVGSETDFDNHFTTYLSGGHFGGAGVDLVLDAFQIMDRWSGDTPARRNLRSAALANLSPWQLFRGLDADATDALMNEANQLGFDRRPVQVEHFCRPSSMFGPYGRTDDRVLVGDTDTLPSMPLAPVADAAPFNVAGLPTAVAGTERPAPARSGRATCSPKWRTASMAGSLRPAASRARGNTGECNLHRRCRSGRKQHCRPRKLR